MRKFFTCFLALLILANPAYAQITSGNAYVDTDSGTDDGSCGLDIGSSACASLSYVIASRFSTLTGAATIHCKGATADTTATDVTGLSTTSSYILTIQVDSSDRHPGYWSTSHYRLDLSDSNYALRIQEPYVNIIGLQVRNTGSGTPNGILVQINDTTDILMDSNIVRSTNYRDISILGGSSVTVRNTVTYDGTAGIYISNTYQTPTVAIANCTNVASSLYGVKQAAGTVTVKNTYAGGNGSSDFDGTMTYTTCASSDATVRSGVTPSIAYSTSSGAYFTGVGSDPDVHITTNSALKNTGTDLSVDFTNDIDADTRGSYGNWDIGVDELDEVPTGTEVGVIGGGLIH